MYDEAEIPKKQMVIIDDIRGFSIKRFPGREILYILCIITLSGEEYNIIELN